MASEKSCASNTLTSPIKRIKMDNPFEHCRDVIFNILCWLPAEFLHNNARYVCKLWADIVQEPYFIRKQLDHSSDGVLIRDLEYSIQFFVIEEGELKCEMSKSNPTTSGEMLASCDGLCLFYEPNCYPNHINLYVGNPITMKAVKLPNPPANHLFLSENSIITRIPHTNEMQVICPALESNEHHSLFVGKVGREISWKKISVKLEQLDNSAPDLVGNDLVSCGHVVYCCVNGNVRFSDIDWFCILAVNLCDCTSYKVRGVPPGFPKSYMLGGFFSMENKLCCLGVSCRARTLLFWILKDSQQQGEWVKLCKVKLLTGLWCTRERFKPIAWLDKHQTLVLVVNWLSGKEKIVYCNVKTGEQTTMKSLGSGSFPAVRHTNSLVSW